MADRGEGKSDAVFGGGLQVNEPYNWEGKGLISGRGGLETAVYGTRRMRVKNVFIYFLFFFFFRVSRRLYRFGSWNWKW